MKTKTPLIVLFILVLFAFTQCKQSTQPVVYQQPAQVQQAQDPQPAYQSQPQYQMPDTVELVLTPRQEQMMNNIQSQVDQLNGHRDVIFELVLEANKKTRKDLEGKAIKTRTRKE